MNKDMGSGFCPTFFRALIAQARCGGASGYYVPGYELARNLDRVMDEVDIEGLEDCLDHDPPDQVGFRSWLRMNLPRIAKLVPTRRIRTFLEGFAQCYEDGNAGWQ